MDTSLTLRDIIATLLGTPPEALSADFPLAGTRLQGSLARTRLYTAIEQSLGVACQEVYTARTYGDLHAAVYGTAPPAAPAPAPRATPHSGPELLVPPVGGLTALACGIDVEMVDNLPVVADYWSDAFYTATFTPAEIAYCLLQEQPVQHFAARWCAKEALKKCDAAYLHMDLRRIEVTVNAQGAPCLCTVEQDHSTPLSVAVSLSHTPQMAVAVVVKPLAVSPSHPPPVPVVTPPVATPPAAVVAGPSWLQLWLPLLLSGGALGLALWGLTT